MSAKPVQYDRLNYNVQSVATSRTTGCYSHTQPRFVSPAGERAVQSHISAGQRPNRRVEARGSWPEPINRHIGPHNFKPWVRVQGAASQSTLADCNRDFLISISITGIYYNIFIKPRSNQGRKKMVKYQADLSGSYRSCGNSTPPTVLPPPLFTSTSPSVSSFLLGE